MSISCVGIFVANTWLAKHLIFYPVSICQQWKQPWAQPCGISTENRCIISSVFGKDYFPLSPCSQVQPNSQHFHSSGWEKHIPVENLQESPDCCFLRCFKGTQSSTPRPCLLTALCTHGISSYYCFFLPRLLLTIITGGSNIKPVCPFSLLSLLAGKWKSIPFVWICVSASQEMKLWSLPDGEWLWLFISLGKHSWGAAWWLQMPVM